MSMRRVSRRGRVIAGISAVMLAVVPAGTTAYDASSISNEAIESRAIFGWPTDVATVGRLRSGADVGTAKWGLAMTKAEETDLRERMAIEQSLEAELLPFVRALPTSGGAWIDQLNGGRLVVTLTTSDEEIRDKIGQLLPATNRGLMFVLVDDTEAELVAAANAAEKVWADSGSSARLLGVTVDTAGNQLVLRFTDADLPKAFSTVDDVQTSLGVSVSAQVDEPDVDAACTSRANCYTPLKPGIHIHNGAMPTNNGNICTMGFHISIGTDEQFLTSGHCGILRTANDWYHSVNYGFVGNEIANLIGPGGKDVMRVGLLDSQATTGIYGQDGSVTGSALPTAGMAISVSLGYGSNQVKTGTVDSIWTSWTSSVCSCTVWGGDASWTTVGGDSGSPVYRVVYQGFPPQLIAIGLNANVSGKFARVADALSAWGGSIFIP